MTLDAFLTSISLGLLSTASPCVLPLYPGFLAYLSGRQQALEGRVARYLLGLFVLAGVLTMMLALGLVIALLSLSIGNALAIVIPIADLLILLLGVLLLADINPFKHLPQARSPVVSNPYLNAFVYGLLYGPITLPCSGPLVVAIFAVSASLGQSLSMLLTFLAFGLGFGLPLLALSLLSGATQRLITRWLARHARLISLAGGLLLILLACYDLWQNREMLQDYWSFAGTSIATLVSRRLCVIHIWG